MYNDQKHISIKYEGIFLDNTEVENLFIKARGQKAKLNQTLMTQHVTTEYKPQTYHPNWYGQKVTIHITSYAMQDVKTEDGNTTTNEGFKVSLTSKNQELNDYLATVVKKFHITGSYNDKAQYTNNIDFSKGQEFNATLTGTFGAFLEDDTIKLD